MRLMFVTAGSRGDVEPFVALARRARDTGHEVRLAIPDNSGAPLHGLDAVSLGADFSQLIQAQGVSALQAARSFSTVVRPTMRAVLVNTVSEALAFSPDVIVYHPKILSAPFAADRLGIPHILVEIVPAITPTREFPAAGTLPFSARPLNRLSYSAVSLASRMFSAELTEARSLAGSGSGRTSHRAASLVPVSPLILSRPGDWPADVHITGAWHSSDPDAPVDEVVAEFLDGGPVVYAGFGSMVLGDPRARARAIVHAARMRGLRVLLATGLGGLDLDDALASDDVLVVPTVDHSRVLPRAVAAIHHGGSGTVHAAARAGTTSIVVPFFADQPFWGALLHRSGLAPTPIPQRRFGADRLGTALDAVPAFTGRVAEVAAAMQSEDGVGVALDLVERYATRARS